jgi:uncharacterized protein GlcG (DUF336 family)
MRSYGLTTISPKATRRRSCQHITNDGQIATCRKGLITAITGAVGSSGGKDSQDEVVSKAGAAVINKLPTEIK